MKTSILAALTVVGTIAASAAPAMANANTTPRAPKCAVVHDHITKTDSGHGTPAEWADLSLTRTTTVCKTAAGYDIKLHDVGHLWTRQGAGTPNGTGGTIAHRVPGKVVGTYWLTATGGTLAHRHGDVSKSSTEYVKSLFSEGTTVTGGKYAWAYTTCREKWLDSSILNDGVGADAGNITGLRCVRKPTPTPTPTDTGMPSPTPTTSTPPGEAPAPTPVNTDLPVTG